VLTDTNGILCHFRE